MWLRILSTAFEKELKILDFAYRLNYYCFVLFDCFSLLLHFLSSLIKRVLCLTFFHRWKASWGKDRSVLLHFIPIQDYSLSRHVIFSRKSWHCVFFFFFWEWGCQHIYLLSFLSKTPLRNCYFRKCITTNKVQNGLFEPLKNSDSLGGFLLVMTPKRFLNDLPLTQKYNELPLVFCCGIAKFSIHCAGP